MVRSWLALVAPLAVLATALHTAFALQVMHTIPTGLQGVLKSGAERGGASQGKELHDTVGKMRDIKHEKYGKSHKKFNYFDQNEDEHITREEFREGLVRLGYKTTDQKLDHILEELDRDPKDERVNFVEFMRPTALKYKEEEELQRDADTDRGTPAHRPARRARRARRAAELPGSPAQRWSTWTPTSTGWSPSASSSSVPSPPTQSPYAPFHRTIPKTLTPRGQGSSTSPS